MNFFMLIPAFVYTFGVIVSFVVNEYIWPMELEDRFQKFVIALCWPLITFIYCLALPVALYIMIRDFRDSE